MKQTIKKILMESLLDNEFRMFVFEKTYKAPVEEKQRWVIYNTILEELRWLGGFTSMKKSS